MKCYQCGFSLKDGAEHCPYCGGFASKEAEQKVFQRIDDELDYDREYREDTGYREFWKPFPIYEGGVRE